jgi:hypothetical protein
MSSILYKWIASQHRAFARTKESIHIQTLSKLPIVRALAAYKEIPLLLALYSLLPDLPLPGYHLHRDLRLAALTFFCLTLAVELPGQAV